MGASSETEICNAALVKVGADRIISLDDDNKRARLCKDRYPVLRDDLLRAHPWNFAIKRVELAQTVNTPLFDFDNEYQLPSDCLRVLKTNYSDDVEEFKIEGDKVLSNTSDMKIKYIAKITNVSLFDDNFVEVLSHKIASDIAYALTQSNPLAQRLFQEYFEMLRRARSFDAQEGMADRTVIASEWVNIRN